MKEELGLADLTITKVYDLGPITVDAGMTNNRPNLFAAIIDGSDMKRVPVFPDNPDAYELRAGAVTFPINKLLELVETNTDAFFRSVVSLVLAKGIVDVRKLV